MTEPLQQVPAHPLERFPGAAKRFTMPMTGIEVVVRRADVDIITADCMKATLQTGVLREVAAEWAKTASESAKEDEKPERYQPELTPEQMLALNREAERAVIRATVIAPAFDDLLALYGGLESHADLGMGPDYRVLVAAVNEMNPTPTDEEGDARRDEAKSVAAPKRGAAQRAGGKVQPDTE